ncbi:MAG: hypothetical protein CMK09_04485 [Ponticaulis sp.]|nr:hypothetical protein [Ponticaulis sp.]|tara:strand:+ start:41204 stop:43903 length:2700 start_codon:yes stop_codon:yes gene_type:complete
MPVPTSNIQSLRLRIIVLAWVVAIISALAVLVSFELGRQAEDRGFEQANKALTAEARLISKGLEDVFSDLAQDVSILSGNPDVKAILQNHSSGDDYRANADDLALLVRPFLQARPEYTQVRVVSFAGSGPELFRMNQTNGEVERVAEAALQEKGGEPYMARAAQMVASAPVFSEVTLNREYGEVDPTETPTIRSMLPIMAADGNPVGVVIINADYPAMIQSILMVSLLEFDVFVIDPQGNTFSVDRQNPVPEFKFGYEAGAETRNLLETAADFPPEFPVSIDDDVLYKFPINISPIAGDFELNILLRVEQQLLKGGLYTGQLILLLLVISVCVIGAAAFATRFTQPLKGVTESIRQYTRTKRAADLILPVSRRDELGELSRAFMNLLREMKDSDVKADNVIQHTVDGVIVINGKGAIEVFNPACEKLFGYSAEEVIGQNVSMLMTEEHRHTHDGYLQNYVKTGDARIIGIGREVMARKKSGEVFALDLSVSEFVQRGERSYCGIVRDLTQRNEARHVIQHQKETLEFALQSGDLGLWDWDRSKGYVDYSDRSAAMIGYRREELRHDFSVWESLIHPDDFPRASELMNQFVTDQTRKYKIEFRMRHKLGHWVWVQARGKVFQRDAEGRPVRIVGVHQDISERKRMEIMKDEFVSTVNHELRTPLTSIFGSLDMLQRLCAGQLDAKRQRLIELAYEGCARLNRLVNDILDLEKIEAGKIEYHLERVNFDELVTVVVNRHQAMADRFMVNFDLETNAAGVNVNVDPDRFNQALVNLLSNASKFSPEGDTVVIRTKILSTGSVRVLVEDHGPGIPDAFRPKIFEKFAQADSSSKRKAQGTGLGLSITKSIIEAFHGQVSFETEIGNGSTFYFDLPICHPKKAPADDDLTFALGVTEVDQKEEV